MTKGDLFNLLKDLPDNVLVVMATDEEGNSFVSVQDVDISCRFDDESGEVGLRVLTEEAIEAGYSHEDVMEYGHDCIILWP